jgi:prepilin-type processing-associated H-X9-DG protein
MGKTASTTGVPDDYPQFGPFWGNGVHTCCHMYVPQGAPQFTVNGRYNTANPTALPAQYAWGTGSYHDGGAHYLMGDGAVRFIGNSVDYNNVFVWLNRISDGNVVSEY